MTPEQLPQVLEEFVEAGEENSCLVVSRTQPALPIDQYFSGEPCVEWLSHVCSAEDLVAVERAALGIVFDQLEHMEKEEGAHLLSRLRDHLCDRVLLHYATGEFSNQELLALGYIKQDRPSIDGRFFLFDPDIFFERRDWNTPEKWANPENFKKYRW
jgi:hypothetical protein